VALILLILSVCEAGAYMHSGYCAERATVRQRKTRRPVRFELTEQTRQAVNDYIKTANKKPGEFLFTACRKQELAVCSAAIRVDFPAHRSLITWRLSDQIFNVSD
jgi:hypothetical protein